MAFFSVIGCFILVNSGNRLCAFPWHYSQMYI